MRRHLSSAHVLALVALFVALGGSSYAAVKLKADSVTSRTVKDGSLLKRDFKAGVLPAATRVIGAAGPAGATGATGPQGEKGDKGDPGERGPSEAVSVYKDGPAGQLGPVDTTLATLDLLPGAYLVEAKLAVASANKVGLGVACELHTGLAKDEVVESIQGTVSLSSHLTTTLASPGTATLKCKVPNAVQPLPIAGDIRLTAVRLGSEKSASL